MKLYAQVVLGLAVEGPFDYEVPFELSRQIRVGSRVVVFLRQKRMPGYVIRLARSTQLPETKKIIALLDGHPVLCASLLKLTRDASDYYCSAWGMVIESALPLAVRSLRGVDLPACGRLSPSGAAPEDQARFIHDPDGSQRWDEYARTINACLEKGRSALVLFPDTAALERGRQKLRVNLAQEPALLLRNKPGELKTWCALRQAEQACVLSTRSGIFAPCNNLGVIIVDEEDASSYKQEQTPHYHTRELAFMRSRIEKSALILAGRTPSFEAYRLIEQKKLSYEHLISSRKYPEFRIMTMKTEYARVSGKRELLSKYLQDMIASALQQKETVLLYYNRKGFATYAACYQCASVLRCPQCSSNLILHYRPETLECRRCGYRATPPDICPHCHKGSIRYSGSGTERVESEISRIFPQARVCRIEGALRSAAIEADIYVATSSVVHGEEFACGLVGIISVDRELNRLDYRAGEKVFALIQRLAGFTEKRVCIQTFFPDHRMFQALLKNEPALFIREELRSRRQLKLPPYVHQIVVKVRGVHEDKVQQRAQELCDLLRTADPQLVIAGVFPGDPARLRGNYFRQIPVSATRPKQAARVIKTVLKGFSASGILVTVDVDPI